MESVKLFGFRDGTELISFPAGSYLNYVVLSSSCFIEAGTAEDWNYVSTYINSASPDELKHTIGDIGYRRKVLSTGIDQTIWSMQRGFIK